MEDEDFLENEETNPYEYQVKAYQSIQPPVQIPSQKRRCRKPVELEETLAQMNTSLTTLNNALSNTTHKNTCKDDCDLYGRLLATKLRSYSEIERQELMYEIDGLLLKKHGSARSSTS
ncbi:hypothetical protein JTB14_008713 [Gonioctena quinquepunctata]|nr:hypothetical protein JTB14_008713 [Gonioctena quinquepunctata]